MRWPSKDCTYLESSFLLQSDPEFHFSSHLCKEHVFYRAGASLESASCCPLFHMQFPWVHVQMTPGPGLKRQPFLSLLHNTHRLCCNSLTNLHQPQHRLPTSAPPSPINGDPYLWLRPHPQWQASAWAAWAIFPGGSFMKRVKGGVSMIS